ncbi:hypothetical protein U8335_03650 [Roseiconus lacunae]|uniref:Uncharacterized protein n=1 Tax=Roseiconus lacunae TaxID=2605694 RepID=A0ABT7PHR1_9BACT|nr:hypothetical protein [Roseiconus lacunae]MDM4016030.1 hypothetical protein [Roseiconus lacunae]WRQ51636.1 hypothetical protein U8335_03650 [Stieleria sp. HD01]
MLKNNSHAFCCRLTIQIIGSGLITVAAVYLTQPPAAVAQDDARALDTKAWGEVYATVASRIDIKPIGSDQRAIELQPRAMLSWDNPVRIGRTEGDFFVWLQGNRPAFVGTIFSYDYPASLQVTRRVAMGFHTVNRQPATLHYQDRLLWNAPAIENEPIRLDLAAPRARRVHRLIQMRQIAAGVKASTLLDENPQDLRLLSKPVYRFELPESGAAESDVLDGAIFALVTGTDPELLLIVEALPTSEGEEQFAWFVTPARFTDLPLQVAIEGVGNIEVPKTSGTKSVYFNYHGVHQLPTALGDSVAEILGD